jgi:CheY-like chemotaxis protein
MNPDAGLQPIPHFAKAIIRAHSLQDYGRLRPAPPGRLGRKGRGQSGSDTIQSNRSYWLYMAIHILTVDDDAGIRRLVQLNLQRAGYRVTTAVDGVDALEKIPADRPDLLILDVTMPRMDGIELLRRVKSDPETADIPVVLLTAKSQDADIQEGSRSGADAYIPKPFNPRQLLEMVEKALRAKDAPAVRD